MAGWSALCCSAGLCGVGDPGVVLGGGGGAVEPGDAVAGGGGEVGADGAEGLDTQGVAFALELAAAEGVEGEPGGGRVAEPAAVLFQDFRVDGAVSGGAGGLLQFQQRVDCLPRPDHVVCGAGLGDGGQLPKQVSTAQSVPGSAVVAVVGLPGVVAGDPGERRQCPGG
jgi:hypothetical protein